MTYTATSYVQSTPLPFSPLTLSELNDRYAEELRTIGVRVCNAVDGLGHRKALDDPMTRRNLVLGALDANAYQFASMQRARAITAQWRAEV